MMVNTDRREGQGLGLAPTIVLANPRGFCAGVERAIRIVELALERLPPPIYVRHEIVHNRSVVERLRALGAEFVEELDEVPDGATVIFSAHGVSAAVEAEAHRRSLTVVDATCPLVAKVHRDVATYVAAGRHVALIGHEGHPEVEGTLGRAPAGSITLIRDEADLRRLPSDRPIAFATQTTLSVDDTARLVTQLTDAHPDAVGPRRHDICYATTNRQAAVRALTRQVDAILVVGSPNSSNSRRLLEVAQSECILAQLVDRAEQIDWAELASARRIGVTAGASAPEESVRSVVAALSERLEGAVAVEMGGVVERAAFPLPTNLQEFKVEQA